MNLIWMDDIAGKILDFVLLKVNQLLPSTCFKKENLKVVMTMFLREIVLVIVRNITNEWRRIANIQVMKGKFVFGCFHGNNLPTKRAEKVSVATKQK